MTINKKCCHAELVSASHNLIRGYRNKFGMTINKKCCHAELVSVSHNLIRGFRNKFGMTINKNAVILNLFQHPLIFIEKSVFLW